MRTWMSWKLVWNVVLICWAEEAEKETRELLGLFLSFISLMAPLKPLNPLIYYRKLYTWQFPCLLSSSLVHMCNRLHFHMRLFIVLLLNNNFYKLNNNSLVFSFTLIWWFVNTNKLTWWLSDLYKSYVCVYESYRLLIVMNYVHKFCINKHYYINKNESISKRMYKH